MSTLEASHAISRRLLTHFMEDILVERPLLERIEEDVGAIDMVNLFGGDKWHNHSLF